MHPTDSQLPPIAMDKEGSTPSLILKQEQTVPTLPPFHTLVSPSQPPSVDVEEMAFILLALKQNLIKTSDASSDYHSDEPEDQTIAQRQHMSVGDSQGEEEIVQEEVPDEHVRVWPDSSDDDWTDFPSNRPMIFKKGAMRKKAPSGAACEKHKRWKKRCPDDCPFRHPRFRKAKRDMLDQSGDLLHLSTEYPQDLSAVAEEAAVSSPPSPPMASVPRRSGSSLKRRNKRGHYHATIACERHTLLHARCPANCPERRPAKPHPRKKQRVDGEEVEIPSAE